VSFYLEKRRGKWGEYTVPNKRKIKRMKGGNVGERAQGK
jgi:hypothetical protein